MQFLIYYLIIIIKQNVNYGIFYGSRKMLCVKWRLGFKVVGHRVM